MSKLKIAQIVNLVSLFDSAKTIHKLTDGVGGVNGAISPQALTVIGKEIFQYMPPKATYLSLGLNIDNSGGVANFITSLRTRAEGEYKETGNKSDTHGVIGITGEESPIRVKGYMAGSSFSDIDIAQAKLEGRNLLGELYQAHGLKYFEKVDELGFKGLFDSDYDRKDSTKEWRDMTDTELLTFTYNLLQEQREGKNANFWADLLVVSPELETKLRTTDYSGYKEGTIAQKIESTFNIRVKSTYRASTAGTGDKEVMLALCSARGSVSSRIPQPLKLSPTHKRGFSNYFEGTFRCAGSDILDLSGGLIGDKL